MGRCDLVANKWPLPTGGIVAEPDFFHLIGNSMADKFRKVKHTSVIIFGGFFGILDGGRMEWVAGIRTGFRHLRTSSIPGSGAEWDGAGSPGDGWRGAYWRGKPESGR